MKKRIMISSIVTVLVLGLLMISGCATSTLKMKRETVDWQQEQAMMQRSLERFDQGFFYVYEFRAGIPAAVVADFKDPDRVIRPGRDWRKLNSREELEQVYKSGKPLWAKAGMKLYRIEGDDGEIWGYFFAFKNVLPYSVIDSKTIELGPVPEPPQPGY
jgi:hypothetical protein